jgi:hypothetical protein
MEHARNCDVVATLVALALGATLVALTLAATLVALTLGATLVALTLAATASSSAKYLTWMGRCCHMAYSGSVLFKRSSIFGSVSENLEICGAIFPTQTSFLFFPFSYFSYHFKLLLRRSKPCL